MKTAQLETAENVITLTVEPRPPKPAAGYRQPFKIQPFSNPRTGSQSWRVTGSKRDGTRVRDNFSEQKAAECRQVELTMEYLARETDTAVRATKLTDTQLRLAETAFTRLDTDQEIMLAVDHWLKHGKEHHVQSTVRIDEAVEQFKEWLTRQPENELSRRSKSNLRLRVNLFANSIGNLDRKSGVLVPLVAVDEQAAVTASCDHYQLQRGKLPEDAIGGCA